MVTKAPWDRGVMVLSGSLRLWPLRNCPRSTQERFIPNPSLPDSNVQALSGHHNCPYEPSVEHLSRGHRVAPRSSGWPLGIRPPCQASHPAPRGLSDEVPTPSGATWEAVVLLPNCPTNPSGSHGSRSLGSKARGNDQANFAALTEDPNPSSVSSLPLAVVMQLGGRRGSNAIPLGVS